TEENEPPLARRAQEFRHEHDDDRADDGTRQATKAADHHHDQNFDRFVEGKMVRVEIASVMRVERTRDSGRECSNEETLALVPDDGNSTRPRRVFILRDSLQRTAKTRMRQPVETEINDCCDG